MKKKLLLLVGILPILSIFIFIIYISTFLNVYQRYIFVSFFQENPYSIIRSEITTGSYRNLKSEEIAKSENFKIILMHWACCPHWSQALEVDKNGKITVISGINPKKVLLIFPDLNYLFKEYSSYSTKEIITIYGKLLWLHENDENKNISVIIKQGSYLLINTIWKDTIDIRNKNGLWRAKVIYENKDKLYY